MRSKATLVAISLTIEYEILECSQAMFSKSS